MEWESARVARRRRGPAQRGQISSIRKTRGRSCCQACRQGRGAGVGGARVVLGRASGDEVLAEGGMGREDAVVRSPGGRPAVGAALWLASDAA
jgi:hypothetical protein